MKNWDLYPDLLDMGNVLWAYRKYEGYGVDSDEAIKVLRWNVRGIHRLKELPVVCTCKSSVADDSLCLRLDGKYHVIYLQIVDDRWFIASIDLDKYDSSVKETKDKK